MITYYGKKVTANELAKLLVYDRGSNAEVWQESSDASPEKMTDKEKAQVDDAVNKQLDRVANLLNIEKIHNKVYD